MFAKSLPLLACFAALSRAAPAVSRAVPDLSGSGYLLVLNATDGLGTSTTEADRVGCLNVKGNLVLDDCAVFSDIMSLPQTSAGQCNFLDETQPLNTDSIYGQSDHGYQCYADADATGLQLYSIVSQLEYLEQIERRAADLYYRTDSSCRMCARETSVACGT